MADFCLECFNEYVLPDDERPRREKDVTLTDWLETCEGCGELKRTVIVDHPESFLRRLFFKILALWTFRK